MSDSKKAATYGAAGVKTNQEAGLDALLKWVTPTEALRAGKLGRSALPIGYYANVVDIGRGQGLALSTDGVGTKVLVAEMLGKYDTIGIDCVAMNVNDVICVGAEPVSMLDYLAVEEARPEVLGAIGKGLAAGAEQAGVNIVGGELSQISEIIKGLEPGSGIDLVGMCAGLVPLGEVNYGQDVNPGDAILGLASSGVHSNGLTLARRVLFDRGGMKPGDRSAELGRTVGEELLEPTRIYVKVVRALMDAGLALKAMLHITSDGLLNLCRIRPDVSFRIHTLPAPQPIFSMIQRLGGVSDEEMFRVFNMGVGFCVILPNDGAVLSRAAAVCRAHGVESLVIGEVTADPARRVHIEPRKIVGEGDSFHAAG
ncbi:MAG: phosphoribosylformylglycinamidine cyclo-ligase [Acidobacteria bacterium]|nr:phosphoribosylformylglycinamidine cyclo-ligase [Acidobacteriota bacterium]